jgi:hypothetical protein
MELKKSAITGHVPGIRQRRSRDQYEIEPSDTTAKAETIEYTDASDESGREAFLSSVLAGNQPQDSDISRTDWRNLLLERNLEWIA